MLYIKRIQFANETEKQQFEQAMCKFAAKRNSPLDFMSAETDFKTEKKFLGYENKKNLQFTRLRSSFEKFLPKLIIQVPKSAEDGYYAIKLSWSSIIPIAFFVCIFPMLVWGIITGAKDYQIMLGIAIVCIGYPLWTLAELDFTKCKVREALDKSINTSTIPNPTS